MKFTSQLLVAASAFCIMACSHKKNTTAETARADDISSVTAMPLASTDATTTTQKQPPITTNANQQARTPVAAGMNPPHGQPGHRCDIEVGAPLNSTPKANRSTNNATQPTISPVFTAADVAPTADGINPPHGQPGHDCAVAVGAPLKK